MRDYNYEMLSKMVQPIMEMMRKEFPNNCKMIIEPDFSHIVFEHSCLFIHSDEMRKRMETAEKCAEEFKGEQRDDMNIALGGLLPLFFEAENGKNANQKQEESTETENNRGVKNGME